METAAIARATHRGRAVEIAVLIEDQVSGGLCPVGRPRKTIEDCEGPSTPFLIRWLQFKCGAVKLITGVCRAVKVAALVEDKCTFGTVCFLI
jgi:hypothetical protein